MMTLAFTPQLKAETANQNIELKYPELMVSPLASKRLEMEMANEKKSNFFKVAPLMVSSSMTLMTALMMNPNDGDAYGENISSGITSASRVGLLVGGAWTALNLYLWQSYDPYESGFKSLPSIQKEGSISDSLTRERMAEEVLINAGQMGVRLKWLSCASNAFAGLIMQSAYSDLNREEKKQNAGSSSMSNQQIMGLLTVAASFGPVLFPSNWERVADHHENYKKRIYGPISMNPTFLNVGQNFIPGFGLGTTFQ